MLCNFPPKGDLESLLWRIEEECHRWSRDIDRVGTGCPYPPCIKGGGSQRPSRVRLLELGPQMGGVPLSGKVQV